MSKLDTIAPLLLVAAFGIGCAQPPPVEQVESSAPADDLRERLTDLQYQVTQQCGTEPPFRNEYWDHHEEGLYVDIVSGAPLFSSHDKFDSGSGWPSFTRPIDVEAVVENADRSLGVLRTEVRSSASDSHLGHVFRDGPAPTGLRWCINSAALRFVPVENLEREGLGDYLALFPDARRDAAGAKEAATGPAREDRALEEAILAGGCFWGMEDILRQLPGVQTTEVGYTGGHLDDPRYEDTHDSASGHAEAIRIRFDPEVLGYGALLDTFFRMHDPTTLNRQGNDRGSQYRSAIFYTSPAQKKGAEEARDRAQASGRWSRPIVTEITAATTFWPAEEHHQDYLEKHPGGYTCHYLRD